MSEPTRFGDWLTLDAPPGGEDVNDYGKVKKGGQGDDDP